MLKFDITFGLITIYFAINDKLHSDLERRKMYYDKAIKNLNFSFE